MEFWFRSVRGTVPLIVRRNLLEELFMSRMLVVALTVLLAVLMLPAQQLHRTHSDFAKKATVQVVNSSASVVANSPRPLLQALMGIAERYAWTINYEDPLYSSGELIDDTNPQWRALHPQAGGTRIPVGGVFRASFPVSPNMERGSEGERVALLKLVADYNQSGNPGKFALLPPAKGFFSVVGKSTRGTAMGQSILDTPVSFSSASRTANATIDLVLEEVTAKTGIAIVKGVTPLNVTALNRVSVGGTAVPARDLLQQTIAQMPIKLVWHLLFDPDQGAYYFNLAKVTQTHRDSLGNEVIEPIP